MPSALSPEASVYFRPQPEQVTIGLTRDLQAIGAEAWSGALPDRGPEQIQRMFDPEGDLVAEGKKYQQYAKTGGLVVAFETPADGQVHQPSTLRPLGFAISELEVSGSLPARVIKELFAKDHVFAHVVQVNVLPQVQRHKIGSNLLSLCLRDVDPKKIVTTHIFKENEHAIEWFRHRGFSLDPDPQEPLEAAAYRYFGKDNPRVDQYRFSVPSVRSIQYPVNSRP